MNRLVIWLLRLAMKVVQSMPQSAAAALGRRSGRLAGALLHSRWDTVLGNLRRAYGTEVPDRELRQLARRNFAHYGESAVEFLRLPLLTRENLDRHVEFRGEERLQGALASGKGAIVLCGHYGNWDLTAVAQALRGMEAHVISKEARHAGVNAVWMSVRSAKGVRFLPPSDSSFAVVRALKRGGTVVVVMDQHRPRAEGVMATFFGLPASTLRTAAVLAIRLGCPVLPIEGYRVAAGRHRIEIGAPLPVRTGRDMDESVLLTTQAYNDAIEAIVRRHPEQWAWIHRRWKSPRHVAAAPTQAG
jgi:KDO2-lipid IV(A) lauroyltransferase